MSSRKILQTLLSRRFTTTARQSADELHPGYKNLYERQTLFQKDDGKPVHLKGGGVDGILYRLTIGLGIVGVSGSFFAYYILAFPPAK